MNEVGTMKEFSMSKVAVASSTTEGEWAHKVLALISLARDSSSFNACLFHTGGT